MNFTNRIEYDYNIDNLEDSTNMIGKILTTIDSISSNPEMEITENNIFVCYPEKPYIRFRDSTLTESIEELRNGIVLYSAPPKSEEVGKEDGTKFFLHPDTLFLGCWYMGTEPEEKIIDIPLSPENPDPLPILYNKAINMWMNNILCGIQNALMNVLKNNTNKNVEISDGTILIEGKKVAIINQFINSSGIFQYGSITYNYDEEFGKATTGDIDNGIVLEKLTGISNEIPGYSKEKFTNEFITEVNRLVEVFEDSRV